MYIISDAECDEITISSDEEMMIALSELKTDLCKLIVRLPEEEVTMDQDIHIAFPFPSCPALSDIQGSAICNSCQKAMQGFRYKCIECLNFYQCSDCEHRGCHPDHVMLRLNQNYPTLISLVSIYF